MEGCCLKRSHHVNKLKLATGTVVPPPPATAAILAEVPSTREKQPFSLQMSHRAEMSHTEPKCPVTSRQMIIVVLSL